MINFLQFSKQQIRLRIAEVQEKATGLPIRKSHPLCIACGCALQKRKKNGNVFFFGKKVKGQGDE